MATCSHNDDIIMTNLNDKQDIHYHLCHQAPLITGMFILIDYDLRNCYYFYYHSFR